MKYVKDFPLELFFWSTGLLLLATANPHSHHFTLCPLANLGYEWCPGCGLGRAITALFNGELSVSFKQHWFGLPALMFIFYRIYQLTQQLFCKNLKHKEN